MDKNKSLTNSEHGFIFDTFKIHSNVFNKEKDCWLFEENDSGEEACFPTDKGVFFPTQKCLPSVKKHSLKKKTCYNKNDVKNWINECIIKRKSDNDEEKGRWLYDEEDGLDEVDEKEEDGEEEEEKEDDFEINIDESGSDFVFKKPTFFFDKFNFVDKNLHYNEKESKICDLFKMINEEDPLLFLIEQTQAKMACLPSFYRMKDLIVPYYQVKPNFINCDSHLMGCDKLHQ
ncbi:hypothetical protein NPIL_515971 [Nephila pilipes]|uniref:Uncharacterized protein n=1 Tax=Nephila pilipes TaxID=299642 RepID=A0A8X6TIN7_NEPPI|nr:hypothetical protein NPIL_515971 [Nephila pilipes]